MSDVFCTVMSLLKSSRGFVGVLGLLLLLATVSQAASYSDRYAAAYNQFERGRYTQAIRDFRNMLATDRTNDLSDNCQYWIGESYFQLGRFDQALVEFDKTLAFPGTNKREDALFKIAQCQERLGETTLAGELYVRFLVEFPQSRHSSAVLKKIEAMGLL